MNADRAKALIGANDRFGQLLGVELGEVRAGYGVATLAIRDEHLNAAGVAHGGAIFTLADIALAAASNAAGTIALLTSGSITVFHPTVVGETLRATAEEISASRRLAHYAVRVEDGAGRAIAVYNASVYKTGRPLTE